MEAVPTVQTEPLSTATSSSRDQDIHSPHGDHHCTGTPIPSHFQNLSHSSLSSETPWTRITVTTTTPKEPVALLECSLDTSCKNSTLCKIDYAEQQQEHSTLCYSQQPSTNAPLQNNCGNPLDRDNSGSNTRWKKRHMATSTTSSFASVSSNNISFTSSSPRPPPIQITTLSTAPFSSASTAPLSLRASISTPVTHNNTLLRASTYKPPSSEIAPGTVIIHSSPLSSSYMPTSCNHSSVYSAIDVTGSDGLGGGDSGTKRPNISIQSQRSNPGNYYGASVTESNGSNCRNSSGSSVISAYENSIWSGHAKQSAGNSEQHWKSSSLSSPSPFCRKYELSLKSIDPSEDLAVPLINLGNQTQNKCQQQQQQQQQQMLSPGVIHGSGYQYPQTGRPLQHPSSTAVVSTSSPESTIHQQGNITNNVSAELDIFSETHSGVIMAVSNIHSNSSDSGSSINNSNNNQHSHLAGTTVSGEGVGGPDCVGLGEFVRSLFSQSLVSRLYSHRPRIPVAGPSSWTILRILNTCHLLYLVPVTTITIARLITIDMICNEQLYSWLTVQAFLFFAQIISTCSTLQHQTMMISSSRSSAYEQRARILLVVLMIWTIIGVGFLGSNNNNAQGACSTTNDPIYSLAFKIVVIHTSIIGFYFLPCNSILLTQVLPTSISSGLTRTATKPMIDKLGSTPMVEGMFGGDTEEATCAICLGDYKPNEVIRFLPCQHHFHLECVDQWLVTDKSCPLCKHDIDKPIEIHHSRRGIAVIHPPCINSHMNEELLQHSNAGPSHSHSNNNNNSVRFDGFHIVIV